MSGSIYDRLKNVLDVQTQEEGISAGDIAALPPALRRIMRLMLREIELTRPAIDAAMESVPAAERLSQADLDQALDALVKQNWLIRRGEGERVNYTVNLRRKAGSGLGLTFWNALDTRIAENKKKDPPSP